MLTGLGAANRTEGQITRYLASRVSFNLDMSWPHFSMQAARLYTICSVLK